MQRIRNENLSDYYRINYFSQMNSPVSFNNVWIIVQRVCFCVGVCVTTDARLF